MVPPRVPAGLVICSARTYTRDYQDVIVGWREAGVAIWGTVPERVAIAAGPEAELSFDGLESYRGVWRRAMRPTARARRAVTSRLAAPGLVELDPSGQVVDEADEAAEHALGDELQQVGGGEAGGEGALHDARVDRTSVEDHGTGEHVDRGVHGVTGLGSVPHRLDVASSRPRPPRTVEWKATP